LRYLIANILFFTLIFPVFSQVDIYNNGVNIRLLKEAKLFVPGNYVGNYNISGDPSLFIDGEFVIEGNLSDLNSGRIIDASGIGYLIFSGQNEQIIQSKGRVNIPGLKILKRGGLIKSKTNLELINQLSFGTNENFELGNNVLYFNSAYSTLSHENNTSRITGDKSIVRTDFPFFLPTGIKDKHLFGLGLIVSTYGNQPFDPFLISRYHSSLSTVGKSGGVSKYYHINSGNSGNLKTLQVNYFENELPAGFQESLLTVFTSKDKLDWIPLAGKMDSQNNSIELTNFPVEKGDNYITIAEKCKTGSLLISTSKQAISGKYYLCGDDSVSFEYKGSDYFFWSRLNASDTISKSRKLWINKQDIVYLNVRNSRGCTNQQKLEIIQKEIPVADFEISPDPNSNLVCKDTELDLLSMPANGVNVSMSHWDIGSNYQYDTSEITHTFNQTGFTIITHHIKDNFGCNSAEVSKTIEILPKPNINFSFDKQSYCQKDTIQISNYSSLESNGISYGLDFNWSYDNINSTTPNPRFPVTNVGLIDLSLSTSPKVNAIGCNLDTLVSIESNYTPVADFDMIYEGKDVSQVCLGESLTSKSQSSIQDLSVLDHSWFLNSTFLSKEDTVETTHGMIGTDKFLLIVESNKGCKDSISQTLNVRPVPTGFFTVNDLSVCEDAEIRVFNNSEPFDELTYSWSLDDSLFSVNQAEFSLGFNSSGSKILKLERTNQYGCSNSQVKSLTIFGKPDVQFSFNEICEDENVFFNDLSKVEHEEIVESRWYINGILRQNGRFFEYKFDTAKKELVQLEVLTKNGCSAQKDSMVFVNHKPVTDIPNPLVRCEEPVQIDINDFNSKYFDDISWYDKNDSLISTSNNAILKNSGIYNLRIQNEKCSREIPIVVALYPSLELPDSIFICHNDKISLSDLYPHSFEDAQWYFENTEIDGRNFIPKESGYYKLEIQQNYLGNICITSDSVFIEINLKPNTGLPSKIAFCENEVFHFQIQNDTYEVTWFNIEESEVIYKTNEIEIDEQGTYAIEINSNGCLFYDTLIVEEYYAPRAVFNVSKTNVCMDEELLIKNYSFNPNLSDTSISFSWFVEDSIISTSPDFQKSFHVSGTKNIRLLAQNNWGCRDTAFQVIEVHPIPESNIIASSVCQGEELNLRIDKPSPINTYKWEFEDASSFEGTEIIRESDEIDYLKFNLRIQNDGCELLKNDSVFIAPSPQLISEIPITTCGESFSIEITPKDSIWFPFSEDLVKETYDEIEIGKSGSYTYIIQNSYGCQKEGTLDLTLNKPFKLEIEDTINFCEPGEITLPSIPGASYFWSNGYSTNKSLIEESGLFFVEIVDQNGCIAKDSIFVTISTLEKFEFPEEISACQGDSILLETNNQLTRWKDGLVSQSRVITSSGFYSAEISDQNCVVRDSVEIKIKPKPTIELKHDLLCAGDNVKFFNSSPIGNTQSTWEINGSKIVGLDTIELIFQDPGIVEVRLTEVHQEGCLENANYQIRINEKPNSEFVFERVCKYDSVELKPIQYEKVEDHIWYFDNAKISSSQLQFPLNKSQNISLEVIGKNGCKSLTTKSIVPYSLPEIDLDSQYEPCTNSLTLGNNPDYESFWSTGEVRDTIFLEQSQLISVQVKNENDCITTDTLNVIISPKSPWLDNNLIENCGNIELDFSDSSNVYYWNGNQLTNLTIQDDTIGYLEMVDVNLCAQSGYIHFNINPVPVLDIPPYNKTCSEEFEITRHDSWESVFLDDVQYSDERITVTPGGHVLRVINDYGCENDRIFEVENFQAPILNLEDTISFCGPSYFNLEDNPNFIYSVNGLFIDSQFPATNTGYYSIKAETTAGCIASDSVFIFVHDLPSIDLGPDKYLCFDETASLSVPGSWEEIVWSTGEDDSLISIDREGLYVVQVSDSNGCIANDSITINIKIPFDFSNLDDSYLCTTDGLELEFDKGLDIEWLRNNEKISGKRAVKINEEGIYKVVVTDEYGCTETHTFNVYDTKEKVEALFVVPSLVTNGDNVIFSFVSDLIPDTYHWDFGDGSSSNKPNPIYRFLSTGEYEVNLQVANSFCSDSKSKLIEVQNIDFFNSGEASLFSSILSLEFSPNPVDEFLNVDFELSEKSFVYLGIYDINGFLKEQRVIEVLNEQIQFDLRDYGVGTYFLYAQSGQEYSVKRFIKN